MQDKKNMTNNKNVNRVFSRENNKKKSENILHMDESSGIKGRTKILTVFVENFQHMKHK